MPGPLSMPNRKLFDGCFTTIGRLTAKPGFSGKTDRDQQTGKWVRRLTNRIERAQNARRRKVQTR